MNSRKIQWIKLTLHSIIILDYFFENVINYHLNLLLNQTLSLKNQF